MKKLVDVKWRLNVIISSRDLSRILEPLVYMELYFSDGTSKSLEVPISRFHALRQSVALLLKETDSINRKGSNIMRIIGPQ